MLHAIVIFAAKVAVV